MFNYVVRRLALVIPTLIGILILNFFIIQLTPGGPLDQYIASVTGDGQIFSDRVGTQTSDAGAGSISEVRSVTQGVDPALVASSGLSPEVLNQIRSQYGFDEPIGTRFLKTLHDYLTFDFGVSYFKARPVMDLIKQALPVSIGLGLGSTLLIYVLSIPLGMLRAWKRNSHFDAFTGTLVVMTSAIPAFMMAVFLIIIFAGGSYLEWFPLRGLVSQKAVALGPWHAVKDYVWHMTLPVLALSLTGLASLTLLTRNCFLDELTKQYVVLGQAKGLTMRRILWRHVFRNAMLIVLSGLPATFIRVFFAGSILIETIFSLNGLGLLGFEATMQRDYPVMFATLWIFTLLGLVANIVGDCVLHWVDPRIHFGSSTGQVG